MEKNNFSFIVSDGPTLPKDAAIRTMIRKQAMRDVAQQRRKRGNYGKVNMRQQPPHDVEQWLEQSSNSSGQSSSGSHQADSIATNSSDDSSSHRSLTTISTSSSARRSCWESSSRQSTSSNTSAEQTSLDSSLFSFADLDWNTFEAVMTTIVPNPLSPFDALSTKFNVDLQDLSGLIAFGFNQPVVGKLADLEVLKTLLGHRKFTYLRYVPSRYGQGSCITPAVDCVMAKFASRVYGSSQFETAAMTLYSKALKEVQLSVSNAEQCQSADTLCAVQLLSIYEQLDSIGEEAWRQHQLGSTQLIQHYKPSRFQSDYEKSLFYAHVGPAVIEALKGPKKCYLEDPAWQQLYLSFIEDSTWLTYRSPITVRIRLGETHLPGVIEGIQNAVISRDIFDPVASRRIRQKVEYIHQYLLDCLEEYKGHLIRTSLLQPSQEELDMRRELLGGCVEHLCLQKRMLATVNDKDRLRLEVEVQALALLLEEIQKQPSPKFAWMFAEHELGIVACVQRTRQQWEEDHSMKSEAEQQDALVHRWSVLYGILNQWEPTDTQVDETESHVSSVNLEDMLWSV